jgi:hypothetical protein
MRPEGLKRPIETEMVRRNRSRFVFFALGLMLGAGCRTAQPLPPADFSTPGWHIQQGQAVWKPSSDRPELAGDLLLATNANGNVFLQFSKTPFPLVTARISGSQWQIEFGADKFSRQGRGVPPDRFAWFQLPRALLGAGPGSHWKFTPPASSAWRLENPHTGETLEGEFFP